MSVDVESLTPAEFLMMLNYEGNPPDDPAFDRIRMTPEEWQQMFPRPRVPQQEEASHAGADTDAQSG